jgi:MSHA biogenesis protein MshJ
VQVRIGELQGLLSGLKRKQQKLTVEFIRPGQMATVLRDMLDNETKLTLTRLESLGVKPLFPRIEASSAEKEKSTAEHSLQNTQEKRPSIYKHGMRVELEGDFNSTLNYLQALESMPWRFYWDNVEYQVLDYPVARIVITVHTLSLDEGWIGV